MALSILMLIFSSFLASSNADPIGDCLVPSVLTLDDADCQLFWECTTNGWAVRQCNDGQYFSDQYNGCVDEINYDCPYDDATTSTSDTCPTVPCQNNGQCIVNSNQEAVCDCADGFTGDFCETAESTSTVSDDGCFPTRGCDNGGTCVLTTDKPNGECSCTADFEGEFCETAVNSQTTVTSCNDLQCENEGRCYEEGGVAQCYCLSGYTGSTCGEDVPEGECAVESTCDPPCENNGLCFQDGGEPACFCTSAYGGEFCEIPLEACESITCQNGGLCQVENDEPVCSCLEGFAGDRCEETVSAECIALDCQNNAPCTIDGSATVCDCLDGYTGDRCQYEDACPLVTCLNGGVCESSDQGTATCNCAPGYSGNFCEIIDNCDSFTCYNGGTCFLDSLTQERKCDCIERTTGEFCELKLNCTGDGVTPCQNGGNCHNTEDGFVCACPIGRTGQFCEEARTCSDSVICENGGSCVDEAEGAECDCTDTFTGQRCQIPVDECGGCLNGGLCETPTLLPANSTEKYCACPRNFIGDHCETAVECTVPCPDLTGTSGERYHTFVFPDIVDKEWVYLCREGRLTHMKYCENTWFDPFDFRCHTDQSFADALSVAGEALFPTTIP